MRLYYALSLFFSISALCGMDQVPAAQADDKGKEPSVTSERCPKGACPICWAPMNERDAKSIQALHCQARCHAACFAIWCKFGLGDCCPDCYNVLVVGEDTREHASIDRFVELPQALSENGLLERLRSAYLKHALLSKLSSEQRESFVRALCRLVLHLRSDRAYMKIVEQRLEARAAGASEKPKEKFLKDSFNALEHEHARRGGMAAPQEQGQVDDFDAAHADESGVVRTLVIENPKVALALLSFAELSMQAFAADEGVSPLIGLGYQLGATALSGYDALRSPAWSWRKMGLIALRTVLAVNNGRVWRKQPWEWSIGNTAGAVFALCGGLGCGYLGHRMSKAFAWMHKRQPSWVTHIAVNGLPSELALYQTCQWVCG